MKCCSTATLLELAVSPALDRLHAELSRRARPLTKQAGEAVTKLRQTARQGKLKREAWEEALTQMIIDGNTRRGHLQTMVAPDCLVAPRLSPRAYSDLAPVSNTKPAAGMANTA